MTLRGMKGRTLCCLRLRMKAGCRAEPHTEEVPPSQGDSLKEGAACAWRAVWASLVTGALGGLANLSDFLGSGA